jgi:hypothetical protein
MVPLEPQKPMPLAVVQQVERVAEAVATFLETRISRPHRLPDLPHIERTPGRFLGQGRNGLL